jgi:hypothetical protein
VEAVAVPVVMTPTELDIMRLLVAQLRDELKKRGRQSHRKKGELQDFLKEAIHLNVPVALVDAA